MFQEIEKQILIILHGGELAVLYCFVFPYLSAAGGGSGINPLGLRVKPALLTRERVGHGVMGMCAWGHVVMASGKGDVYKFISIYFGTIQAERARGQVLLFDILFTMGNNRGMKV